MNVASISSSRDSSDGGSVGSDGLVATNFPISQVSITDLSTVRIDRFIRELEAAGITVDKDSVDRELKI
jgi:hypothetical protein